jgi:protein O-GlcNAc transferase
MLLLALQAVFFLCSTAGGEPPILVVDPADVPAYEAYNRAVALARAGDTTGAISEYEKALELKWDLPEAHVNIALLIEDDVPKSAFHILQSINYGRDDKFKSSSLVNLAILRIHSTGRYPGKSAEIEDLLLRALALNPNNGDALTTLGSFYTEELRHREAETNLRAAVEIAPENGVAKMNLGNHYFHLKQFSTAIKWFHEAVALISPDNRNYILIRNNMGQSYREGGRYLLAASSFAAALRAINCPKELSLCLWTLSNMLAVQGIASNWSDMELTEHRLDAAVFGGGGDAVAGARRGQRRLPASMPASSSFSVDLYTYMLQRFASSRDDLALASSPSLGCAWMPQGNDVVAAPGLRGGGGEERIRVGYLSYDWRDHPMGRLTMALATAHDRRKAQTTCFYYGPEDGVNVSFQYEGGRAATGGSAAGGLGGRAVYATQQDFFRANCERFVDLSAVVRGAREPMTDDEAQRVIRSFGLHVLVDLTAHTTGGRLGLSAVGAAQVTINYLGYPGTTGM